MNYQEWRKRVSTITGLNEAFYRIIDFSWTPAEQNELARLWKAWASE